MSRHSCPLGWSNSPASPPRRGLFEFAGIRYFRMSSHGIALHRLATPFVHNKYTEVRLITKISLGLGFLVACCTIGWTADTFHPLDVKTGEWESTMTRDTQGVHTIPLQHLAT